MGFIEKKVSFFFCKFEILIGGINFNSFFLWLFSCVTVLKSHVSIIRGLDVSNDGKYLLSGSRDKVANLWDLNKKKLIKTFPIYEVL
jgi:U3 small nucleolar RNA-associated protein 13